MQLKTIWPIKFLAFYPKATNNLFKVGLVIEPFQNACVLQPKILIVFQEPKDGFITKLRDSRAMKSCECFERLNKVSCINASNTSKYQ